jgi:hypothetical protein
MGEFELKEKAVLLPGWAGTGVQFNAHTFAKQSGLSEPQFPELERRVTALSPQLVRLFYNHNHHGNPVPPGAQDSVQKDRWDSFVRSAQLAQSTNAAINVTWQSIVVAGGTDQEIAARRKEKVRQFADVLELLVDAGITNLKWATVQNEPNTVPHKPKPQVTQETVAAAYHDLHDLLTAKGLRKQIHLMGGDLIEGPTKGPGRERFNQEPWFHFMSENYADILNAYSVHIYWTYNETRKIERRLDGVRKIVDGIVKRPLYVTECGAKGLDIFNKKTNPTGGPKPGRYIAGNRKIDVGRTKVAAFQQAWFLITAAQQRYSGVLKWDCHYGVYDNAPQTAYAIGKPGRKGWPLYPSYHLLRMVTLTTEPGWDVIEVAPLDNHATQRVAAFAGGGDLTLLGLDAERADKNEPSSKSSTYMLSGLPARKRFSLLMWNRGGGGQLVIDSTATTDARGHLPPISVPLQSVFALTTKKLPPL